jgi:hypothetical protein
MSAASAQTIGAVAGDKARVTAVATLEAPVRVSLGINMFVPASDGDGAQALKAQEDGRKMIYEAATRECEVLRASIASDCHLESININVQRVSASQNYAQRTDGYNISGNMSYRIGVK